jgi:hypothetical protein
MESLTFESFHVASRMFSSNAPVFGNPQNSRKAWKSLAVKSLSLLLLTPCYAHGNIKTPRKLNRGYSLVEQVAGAVFSQNYYAARILQANG